MNTYPSTPNPTTITESFNKKQNRTPFEDGTVQSRVMHTRGRGRWELSYTALDLTDVYVFRDFFYTNQGSLFYWTHPISKVQYDARFTEDSFSSDILSPTNCSFSIQIEEA